MRNFVFGLEESLHTVSLCGIFIENQSVSLHSNGFSIDLKLSSGSRYYPVIYLSLYVNLVLIGSWNSGSGQFKSIGGHR